MFVFYHNNLMLQGFHILELTSQVSILPLKPQLVRCNSDVKSQQQILYLFTIISAFLISKNDPNWLVQWTHMTSGA